MEVMFFNLSWSSKFGLFNIFTRVGYLVEDLVEISENSLSFW